jgi:hypothetical protein
VVSELLTINQQVHKKRPYDSPVESRKPRCVTILLTSLYSDSGIKDCLKTNQWLVFKPLCVILRLELQIVTVKKFPHTAMRPDFTNSTWWVGAREECYNKSTINSGYRS